MTNACFGIFDKDFPKKFKFKNTNWIHIVGGKEVTAMIIFRSPRELDNYSIIYGKVLDYLPGINQKVILGEDDIPYLHGDHILEPVEINFQIINRKYIKAERKSQLNMLLQNLNIVAGSQNIARHIAFNIKEIDNDYPIQWFGNIERSIENNWRTGKLKGHDIAQDADLKKFYSTTPKNNIGITLPLEEDVKIKISINGMIQIAKLEQEHDFVPDGDDMIKLFMTILLPYIQIGRKPFRVKNR